MEENNKIIAEFMNFPKITNVRDSESGKYYDYWLPNNFNLILEQEIQIESNNGWGLVHQDCVFVRDLIFHSDWNWLMKVVEKIYQTDLYYDKYIDFNSSMFSNGKIELSTNKESVYNDCIDFINFYNKQKEE